jgi:hypothetical protein
MGMMRKVGISIVTFPKILKVCCCICVEFGVFVLFHEKVPSNARNSEKLFESIWSKSIDP